MSKDLESLFNEAVKELKEQFENSTSKYHSFFENSEYEGKQFFLMLYKRIVENHVDSIIFLIKNKKYTSAFSLLRLVIETVYRAIYMYEKFSHNDLDKLKKDEYKWVKRSSFHNIHKFAGDIEISGKKLFSIKEIFEGMKLETIQQDPNYARKYLNNLHSLTHAGVKQFNYNFKEESKTIEDNYPLYDQFMVIFLSVKYYLSFLDYVLPKLGFEQKELFSQLS